MYRRHPLPRLWLMTDERVGDELWPALRLLPRGAGVVFRHQATAAVARRALFDRVRQVARARGLVLVLAGPPQAAIAWRADGAHGRSPHRTAPRPLVRTAGAHDRREMIAAIRAGAEVMFLSPLFPTRSHPGGRVLGVARFGLSIPRQLLSRDSSSARPRSLLVIALGGMDRHRFRRAAPLGADGWAAIDAWRRPDGIRT